MKKIVKFGMALCLSAALSFAATTKQLHGKLIDANCHNHGMKAGKSKSCAPTASTVNFALERRHVFGLGRGGKVYKLNPAGNAAAAAAFRKGDLKPGRSGAYHVVVTGSRQGDVINVQSVRGHKSNKVVS